MTLTMNDYVRTVVDRMPNGTPRRTQIEMELRSHINERLEHGQTLDHVLKQLGDPEILAESYFAEVPLVAAGFWERAVAKILDLITVIVCLAPVAYLIGWTVAPLVGLIFELISVSLLFAVYTVVCEWQLGQTVGKRLMHLRVVRESGARLGLGESFVRQLPQMLQVFWIDVMFVLFTERHQRAFELLSKTRVVKSGALQAL